MGFWVGMVDGGGVAVTCDSPGRHGDKLVGSSGMPVRFCHGGFFGGATVARLDGSSWQLVRFCHGPCRFIHACQAFFGVSILCWVGYDSSVNVTTHFVFWKID